MKRRKSPKLKKQDEYDKDYRPHMENPHAFRKNWPKNKARANRGERVAVRAMLISSNHTELTAGAVKGVRRKQERILKSGVVTLRQRIKDNRAKRAGKANRKSRRGQSG